MKTDKPDTDLIVVGGGASGLMAAITAAEQGHTILLLEKQERTGKKLSATGNGKCNFTNLDMQADYFFPDTDFVRPALETFSNDQAVAFFKETGIAVTERNGYCYPAGGQAAIVRDALLFRFLNVSFRTHQGRMGRCKCGCEVTAISQKHGLFYVKLADGYTYRARSVILACGSRAAPQLGGSASGELLAQGFGHTIIPQLPALCGLKIKKKGWEKAAGVRVKAEISLYNGQKPASVQQGELQLTSYGISGIPVFQLSIRAVQALARGRKLSVQMRFLPDMEQNEVFDFLLCQKNRFPHKPVTGLLSGLLPNKLAGLILDSVLPDQKNIQADMLSDTVIHAITDSICAYSAPVTGHMGFEQAQAASGGVDRQEIDVNTMQSRLVPGLFFAGEMIDVCALCGGYNLQWAWSSGYLAAMGASDYIRQKKDSY